jgi:hypothetical protein
LAISRNNFVGECVTFCQKQRRGRMHDVYATRDPFQTSILQVLPQFAWHKIISIWNFLNICLTISAGPVSSCLWITVTFDWYSNKNCSWLNMCHKMTIWTSTKTFLELFHVTLRNIKNIFFVYGDAACGSSTW